MPEARARGRLRVAPRTVASTLALALIVPLALLALGEALFRVAGVGRETAFFVTSGEIGGADAVATNPLYGYTYFDSSYAIRPAPQRLTRSPAPDAGRAVVLGASAAFGDVAPEFSLARVLEARLESLDPRRQVEVINAALPGINSHVALDIAREAMRLEPQVLVVYLGNNEVVGPYGPGSVAAVGAGAAVARLPPPRWRLRTHMALRSLRWAQLVSRLSLGSAAPDAAAVGTDWAGAGTGRVDVEALRRLEVPVDDPRLERVAAHSEENLRRIVRLGRRGGATVVLSTVGSNLRDFAPFASRRASLGTADRAAFDDAYRRGLNARQAGDCAAAESAFAAAAALDDGFADLWFHRGRCALVNGHHDEARDMLTRARDLDVQRYRPDARLDAVVRRVAADEGAVLVDAAAVLVGADGIGDAADFYDHVHLTFGGMLRLADALLPAVAEALELSLPEAERSFESRAIAVARALVLDRRAEAEASTAILRRHRQPMMAGRQVLTEGLAAPPPRFASVVLDGAELDLLRRALERRPGDVTLRARQAEALERAGQSAGALLRWSDLVAELPRQTDWQIARARLLAARGDRAAAIAALDEAVARDPFEPRAGVALANLLRAEDPGRAEAVYRDTLRRHSASSAARLGLASLLAADERHIEARQVLESAVALDPSLVAARVDLALLLLDAGEVDGAREQVLAARRLAPSDPQVLRLARALGLAPG
ncbi:MAG: tetratricopeptide repeat protein [Acidobacteriota bacterium]